MEDLRAQVSISPKMAEILQIFLQAPDRPRYGYELMKATGQPSGTLYPILAFLERQGWIEGTKEDIDPGQAGRPRRRALVLTPDGYLQALDRLQTLSDTYRPPLISPCPPADSCSSLNSGRFSRRGRA